MSKPKKPSRKEMVEMLKETYGNISLAAKKMGYPHTTFYRWVKNDTSGKIADAIEEGSEKLVDFAENKLLAKINDGSIPCIIFALKCKGKARGYIERNEINQKVEGGLDINSKIDSDVRITINKRIVNSREELENVPKFAQVIDPITKEPIKSEILSIFGKKNGA